MDILINSEDKKTKAIDHIAALDLSYSYRIKIAKVVKKRTLTQNRALHLFFKHMAIHLNSIGQNFHFSGIKGLDLEIPYNEILVKETIWKPIQKTMFEIDSTTDLDTFMINKILDVLTHFFARNNIQLNFPSNIELLIKQLNENEI